MVTSVSCKISAIDFVRKLLGFCFVLFSAALLAVDKPLAPEEVNGAHIITAEQVVNMLLAQPDVVVIDSRKNSEYLKGHIEGAINLLNTEMQLSDLTSIASDKKQAIIFYCNGERCLRSSDAASKAISWGYKNVFWFRGGWKEWSDKRLPVATDEKK